MLPTPESSMFSLCNFEVLKRNENLVINDKRCYGCFQAPSRDIWHGRLSLMSKFSTATSKVIVGEDYMQEMLNYYYVVVL
jgi:hypothetical protein